ncbi:cysteine proteinase [Guyanagaster necrorhizus]|uniref:Cysteine proteinase n=1 Tax=Guyanagaster necrorhizus TaxID=856835 RepID=A0A9P7VLM1_9AGAR|nr:cysteine proteinase [Guyanagaster necrorhizus MCA 3950]KAG7442737.1 cysteine proteinase [Guyanagaster necrorhizus MCA 3950]
MGSARRIRSRTTRSSKAKLLTDPTSSTAELQSQLRSLGLYAAPTVGDGNCLFRALSDQYYGSPARHAQVRRDVCDWIAQHRERYEGFVDVDEFGSGKEGLEGYLRGMRENATYGGHMELSAFAHLTKRNIKVVQPGLVYVIQCESPKTLHAPASIIKQEEGEQVMNLDGLNDRDRRKIRRDRRRTDGVEEECDPPDGEDSTSGPTIYVAYHDWEHFSSIRNLRGPHVGLPCIQETQVSDEDGDIIPSTTISKNAKKRELKNAMKRKTVGKVKLRLSHPSPADPSQVPLPVTPARSVSPASTYTPPPPSTSPTPAPPNLNSLPPPARLQRSPKRSFDETSVSGSSETTDTAKSQEEDEREGRAKRTRTSSFIQMTIIDDFDEPLSELSSSESEDDDDEQSPPRTTPSLSPASSAASSSESSSPRGSPAPIGAEKPMTRRQRKRLGLPKSRPSAGKIIIPGGRYVPRSVVQVTNIDVEDEEWRRNGSGRVDVRGFRELKI